MTCHNQNHRGVWKFWHTAIPVGHFTPVGACSAPNAMCMPYSICVCGYALTSGSGRVLGTIGQWGFTMPWGISRHHNPLCILVHPGFPCTLANTSHPFPTSVNHTVCPQGVPVTSSAFFHTLNRHTPFHSHPPRHNCAKCIHHSPHALINIVFSSFHWFPNPLTAL